MKTPSSYRILDHVTDMAQKAFAHPESMVERFEGFKPFAGPFFGSVTPPSSPLTVSPRVANLEEPFAAELDGLENRVRMHWKVQVNAGHRGNQMAY